LPHNGVRPRLAALVPESREGAPDPPPRVSASTALFRLNGHSAIDGAPRLFQATLAGNAVIIFDLEEAGPVK